MRKLIEAKVKEIEEEYDVVDSKPLNRFGFWFLNIFAPIYLWLFPVLCIDWYIKGLSSNWLEIANRILCTIYSPIIVLAWFLLCYPIIYWRCVYEVLDIRKRYGNKYRQPRQLQPSKAAQYRRCDYDKL